ncbi:hypothetical protein BH10BAC6_BH10BAC6_13810 [soil metagenome]
MTTKQSMVVVFMLIACNCAMAQLPQTISFQAYATRDGEVLHGSHRVTVRWYEGVAVAVVRFEEYYDAEFISGVVALSLGSQSGLPLDLLAGGTVYLGISVDGEEEMMPRTALASVPYALNASHAETATALDREVSGVVTSVNEVAGNVRLIGDASTRVTKNGNTITISASPPSQPLVNGVVTPDGRSSTFTVTAPKTLSARTRITAVVIAQSGESIGCCVSKIDEMAGTFSITTAAILLPTERIHWFLLSE